MSGVVAGVVALGMLVVVPLGLRLVAAPGLGLVRRAWPVAAVPGAVSLWIDRGPVAACAASPYVGVTAVLAGCALVRAASLRSLDARQVAVTTALVTPVIAGIVLLAERGGHRLFGFDLGILALTVAHFHYAGFAAALVAGLVCRAVGDGTLARAAALTVPVGTLVVLAGFFAGEAVELLGAVVLTAGMWLVGGLTWREIRPQVDDRLTRGLLAGSALVIGVTMLLAVSWALGELASTPHLSLGWMVRTHGLANALGFALCALLAWRRLPVDPV